MYQRSIAPHVDLRSLDEVARDRLDRQLVDAIAERVPGDQREGVRQMLTLPDGTIHSEISIPNGALAPELAPVLPLLQQLTQLRAARYQPADGAPHASVNHDPFRVVLVLAQDMRTDDGIAAVLREAPVISIPRVGLGRAYGFVPRPTPNP